MGQDQAMLKQRILDRELQTEYSKVLPRIQFKAALYLDQFTDINFSEW